jgi:hypothetical protein
VIHVAVAPKMTVDETTAMPEALTTDLGLVNHGSFSELKKRSVE